VFSAASSEDEQPVSVNARAVAIASEICILFFISYLSYFESIPGRAGDERNLRGDSKQDV